MPWSQGQRPQSLHIPSMSNNSKNGEYYVPPNPANPQTSPRYPPTSPHYQYTHPPPPHPHHHPHHHHRPADYQGPQPYRYVVPPSNRFQVPGAFDTYDTYDTPPQQYSYDPRIPGAFEYDGYDYSQQPPPPPPMAMYDPTQDPRPMRRRGRSRASSKASSANNDAPESTESGVMRRAKSRRRRERERQAAQKQQETPKYQATVESAPNSPAMLPSLPTEGASTLEEDSDYLSTLPLSMLTLGSDEDDEKQSPRDFREWLKINRHKIIKEHIAKMDVPVILERQRKPYGGATTTATKTEKAPEESSPVLRERERRQYATHAEYKDGAAPEIAPKKRSPYAYNPHQYLQPEPSVPSSAREEGRRRRMSRGYSPGPTPPPQQQSRHEEFYDNRAERRRSGYYASTGADMHYSKEDPMGRYEDRYPASHRNKDPPREIYQDEYYNERGKQPYYDDSSRGRNGSVASSHGTSSSHHSHRHDSHGSYGSSVNAPRRHAPRPPPRSPSPEPPREIEPVREPELTHDHSLVRVPSDDSFLIGREAIPSPMLHLVPVCPKRKLVSRGTWFYNPQAPTFLACERCYEMHIYKSRFYEQFETRELQDGERAYCSFNTPRVLEKIWPAAIEQRSFEVFIQYALQRSRITNCTATSSTTHGIWYCIKEQYTRYHIDGDEYQVSLLACEACYEDIIAESDYAKYFERRSAANPKGLNSCHISVPYIENELRQKDPEWAQFLRNVDYRLNDVTPCPRDGVIVVRDTRQPWFKPYDTTYPIYICETCYCDGIVPTDFVQDFEECYIDNPDQQVFCSMGAFTLTVIWDQAVDRNDLSIFIQAVEAAWRRPCISDGSYPPPTSNDYHELTDPSLSGFIICTRCLDTYFIPLGFQLQTRPLADRPLPPPGACSLSSHYTRDIVMRLGEAAAWRELDIFKEFLLHRRPSQLCPKTRIEPRAIWYTFDDLRVCEECWRFRIALSPFASQLRKLSPRAPVKGRCDMGDETGRALWEVAARKADLGWLVVATRVKREGEVVRERRREAEGRVRDLKAVVEAGRGRERYGRWSVEDEVREVEVEVELLRRQEEGVVRRLGELM